MSFYIYDIVLFILTAIAVIVFIKRNRQKLTREGIIYLYKTKFGLKFINNISKKYQGALRVLQYLSVVCGYLLMIGMLFLLFTTIYTYAKFPEITKQIKTPPVFPLIPYFPELFGLESFFPPFYFTYWIIALAIVALVHEAGHGILARYNKIRVKSTGFAFLGPFLGAFVEPDEKQLQKKSIFAQLSVLSAGTFANVITALVIFLLLWLTFGATFHEAGVLINGYAGDNVNIGDIKLIDGKVFNGTILLNENNLTKISTTDRGYYIKKDIFEKRLQKDNSKIYLYYRAPAVENNLRGAITKINYKKISNSRDLQFVLSKLNPSDEIIIETKTSNDSTTIKVALAEHPDKPGEAFLGIISQTQPRSSLGKAIHGVLFFNDPTVYYEKQNGILLFVYNMLWWIFIINIFVALFNMLPLGILDGGRFFMLTITALTKSEETGRKAYKFLTYVILILFILLFLSWLIAL